MPLEFLGVSSDKKDTQRIMTGLFSLDHAFCNEKKQYGFPVGIGIEIYGAKGIGKSTFVYSLAGIIAREQQGNIVLVDLEGFDVGFMASVLNSVGMTDGKIQILPEDGDKEESHEVILQNFLDLMKEKSNVVGILDSVGAVSPIAEMQGEFGEANMGKRAKLMAQYSRRAIHFQKFFQPLTLFMTNHMLANFSGYGISTPGGEVKNYLNSVIIHLSRKEVFPDGSYILQGKVKKNRWGYNDRVFYVFVRAGYGIHFGLSAMFDGMMLGKVKRGKSGVKIGTESYGYLKNIIKKADEYDFTPFFDVLRNSGNIELGDKDSEDTDLEDQDTD